MSAPVSLIVSPEERMSLARSVIAAGSTWGSGKVSGKILLPSEGSTSSAAFSLVGRLVAAGASRQSGGGGWGVIEGLFRGVTQRCSVGAECYGDMVRYIETRVQ